MDFDEVLRAQDGVISRRQAARCGISPRALRGRVTRGSLREVAPGVYRSVAHHPTSWSRIVAASLWAGSDAVVDGPAAAYLHGLLRRLPRGTTIGLTVPATTRRTAPAGTRLRRRDLHPADRAVHRGIGVTAPPLTALDTAVVLPDGAAFLDRALQQGLPFVEVLAAYHRAIGTRGTSRARDLVIEAGDRADSRAERRLIGHLRNAGIAGFVQNMPFGPWFVDIAFPDSRLAIEVDGWAFHSDPQRFRNDRRKQNALVGAGWTVLRFTWQDIRDRPEETVRRIRRALGA